MVFYAHLLQEALDSPTIVVITDRNDLDDQLYGQFAKCKEFLRQEPIHAESRENLKSLLAGRQANGIIFTTMQKFEESHEALSERNNIIVMADEAHRGQYGLTETVDAKTGKIKIGTARIIRNTLPNATYIGFTGTPISSKDRSTREVFGDYIDIYDMTQAVEDGATRPVYYESRVIKLNLDEDTLRLIDSEYDVMAENADGEVVEKSKRELGKMEAVLGNDNTINSLVCDILDHYENNRENLLTGKAMIVAYSRPIAMKIYKRILELRPAWTEKVGVVMTSGNNDPEEWRKIIGNKHHKDELAKKFKDNNSTMKIAIVVDMWLTGFDVPSLATMYVYKPMSGHNLMQAIARVNRVFRDKEGGLVVDYVGIASALKQAMNDYTSRDKKNYGDTDVAKVAYPKFLEKLSVCRDMFHGYDYSKFTGGTDLERAKTISGAVNFIMDREKVDDKDSFVKEALMLHQALSLCSSLVDEESRFEAAFFESVRVLVLRLTNTGVGKKISLPEMNARINELLKQSIKSDGVINLFSDIKEDFSLFDPKFLEEVANMKEKNLAVELLKKLIAEQVSVYRRTNVVKSEKFSEIMQRSLNAYLNGMLTNEEVIEEMLNLAKQIATAKKEGDQLGLTADELAFYDALTKPQAIKDFYENEELIAITKELADTLRRNKTIDWQKRESARAKMRMLIKKLLKKHKYPPEGMEDAVQTVMTQCELWTDTPKVYEPVYLCKVNRDIDLQEIAKNSIGRLPGSDMSIPIKNINALVTHNTAVLGILGVGKSCLTFELIKKIVAAGIKVICLDITNQYASDNGLYKYIPEAQIVSDLLQAKIDELESQSMRTGTSDSKSSWGNVENFKKLMESAVSGFMDANNKSVMVLNPEKYIVRQAATDFRITELKDVSLVEKVQIISEIVLKKCMDLGQIDRARCCVVYEEAHSLTPEFNSVVVKDDNSHANGTAKVILQGRKYGLGCIIVTQRTANVTKSILNQCNTIFALRVFDDTGKSFLENYIGRDYSDTLPTLEERHAIAIGKGIGLKQPVILQLNDMKYLQTNDGEEIVEKNECVDVEIEEITPNL